MHAHTHAPFSPDQLARLEATLHEQRRFRLAQITVLRSPAPPEDEEIRRAVLQGALTALRDTDAALARLADGTYGRCIQCHLQLSAERLQALPQSPRCTACERSRS